MDHLGKNGLYFSCLNFFFRWHEKQSVGGCEVGGRDVESVYIATLYSECHPPPPPHRVECVGGEEQGGLPAVDL